LENSPLDKNSSSNVFYEKYSFKENKNDRKVFDKLTFGNMYLLNKKFEEKYFTLIKISLAS